MSCVFAGVLGPRVCFSVKLFLIRTRRLSRLKRTAYTSPILGALARFLPTPQVRQYFTDESFYAVDQEARGFCDDWSGCEAFSPSSATVKVGSSISVACL